MPPVRCAAAVRARTAPLEEKDTSQATHYRKRGVVRSTCALANGWRPHAGGHGCRARRRNTRMRSDLISGLKIGLSGAILVRCREVWLARTYSLNEPIRTTSGADWIIRPEPMSFSFGFVRPMDLVARIWRPLQCKRRSLPKHADTRLVSRRTY